jgi:hypothetical protein
MSGEIPQALNPSGVEATVKLYEGERWIASMVFGVGFKYNMTDLHSGAESASNRYRQLRGVEDRRRGSPPRPLSVMPFYRLSLPGCYPNSQA